MNATTAPFHGTTPALKLTRRPPGTETMPPLPAAAEHPAQCAAEFELLREREQNLRDYEARLRAWQEQLETAANHGRTTTAPFLRPSSQTPFGRDPELEAAWSKLHRARALLEAEQNQMRDDRLTFRDLEAALKRRESELAERETQLAARECRVAAAEAAHAAAETAPSAAPAGRSARGPLAAAKALFRAGK